MPGRPNILWIVTTQWRAQACGYAGDPNARTPFLDGLAARSVNYCQAVTPHPFGPFARAALFTGVSSPVNGVKAYFDPLPPNARTIAHDLRAAGYRTGFFGKWHLAPRDPAAPLVGEAHARTIVPPAARGGFDYWEGFESGFLLNDPWLHGTAIATPRRFAGYQSDVLGQRAADWMTAAGSAAPDWFAVVSLEPPHPPYDAPASQVAPRDPRTLVLPANVPSGTPAELRARRELAGYYAHLEATDAALAKLVAAADRASGAKGCIVVFTSAHGDMHGAHGLFRKGWPHEESVRVPLLVRRPGAAPRRDDSPVSLLDLASMTAAWARGGPVDIASAPAAAHISMPSVVPLPLQCDRAWRGVRTSRRKYVANVDGTPWLFFDLEEDPGEQRNLATDPARTGEMAELARHVADC